MAAGMQTLEVQLRFVSFGIMPKAATPRRLGEIDADDTSSLNLVFPRQECRRRIDQHIQLSTSTKIRSTHLWHAMNATVDFH